MRKVRDVGGSDLPEGRLLGILIASASMLSFGIWTAAHIERAVGSTALSYYGGILLATAMIALGGLGLIRIAQIVTE